MWLSEVQVGALTQAGRGGAIPGILLPPHSSLPRWLHGSSQVAFPVPVDEGKIHQGPSFTEAGAHWSLGIPIEPIIGLEIWGLQVSVCLSFLRKYLVIPSPLTHLKEGRRKEDQLVAVGLREQNILRETL